MACGEWNLGGRDLALVLDPEKVRDGDLDHLLIDLDRGKTANITDLIIAVYEHFKLPEIVRVHDDHRFEMAKLAGVDFKPERICTPRIYTDIDELTSRKLAEMILQLGRGVADEQKDKLNRVRETFPEHTEVKMYDTSLRVRCILDAWMLDILAYNYNIGVARKPGEAAGVSVPLGTLPMEEIQP